MASRPQLTWPGLLALIAVALLLAYLERNSGGDGGRPVEADRGAPQSTTARNSDRDRTAASSKNDPRDGEGGNFDYYSLVLSWSPTHCASSEGRDDDSQCARRDGRRYAFVLHGLWPQYERGYPEDCPTRTRPYVPQSVIDDMFDIMPSKGLIIHEYRKHGTCSGLSPETYFQTARRFFARLKLPERFRNPSEQQFLDTRDVVREFVAANPQLKPDMMAVDCGGSSGRLQEIRVCFTKAGEFRSCGRNEGGLCRSSRVNVPPVR